MKNYQATGGLCFSNSPYNNYYYALESIKTVVTKSGHQDDEDEEGLGHMTAKPLKNGRKYVDSGFVHDMMDTKTEEHYFLKAHVWPSMRNELPPQCFDNLISVKWCSHSGTHHAIPAKSLH